MSSSRLSILAQAAVRAPVILLVVYDLGALGAKNRGMYFAPTALTGMLLGFKSS